MIDKFNKPPFRYYRFISTGKSIEKKETFLTFLKQVRVH